jgi:DNA polymerase III sliding clamp (beta) subunit (PCNA family)
MKKLKYRAAREDGAQTLISNYINSFTEYEYNPERLDLVGVEKTDGKEFPFALPTTLNELDGVSDVDNLFAAIRRVQSVASKEDVKPTLTAVHLVLKGDKPFVEACDGYRLCKVFVDESYGKRDIEALIPAHACSYGAWQRRGYDTLALNSQKRQAVFFRREDTLLALETRTVEGEFINSEQLLGSAVADTENRRICLDRKQARAVFSTFVQVSKRVVYELRKSGVRIRVQGDTVEISYRIDEDEYWTETLSASGDDLNGAVVQVNPKYMLDAINSLDTKCEYVHIGLPEKSASPIFAGNLDDGNQALNIVLPMRITEPKQASGEAAASA